MDTMEDDNAESLKYVVQSKSRDSFQGVCGDRRERRMIALLPPHSQGGSGEPITEIRDPVPDEDPSNSLIDTCLTPPPSMTASCTVSEKAPNIMTPKLTLPPAGVDEFVPNVTYEVIGEKADEKKSSTKKMSKKRWSFFSYNKEEGTNVEKSTVQKRMVADRETEFPGRREKSTQKPESRQSRSHSRSRSRSRGRATSHEKATTRTASPTKRVTPATKGHSNVAPDKVSKHKCVNDLSSKHLTQNTKTLSSRRSKSHERSGKVERHDQTSRHASNERKARGRSLERRSYKTKDRKSDDGDQPRGHPNLTSHNETVQEEFALISAQQLPRLMNNVDSMAILIDEINKRASDIIIRASKSKGKIEQDRRTHGSVESLAQVATNLQEGDVQNVPIAPVQSMGHRNTTPFNPVHATSSGMAILESSTSTVSPRGALRSCLKKSDDTKNQEVSIDNEIKKTNSDIAVDYFFRSGKSAEKKQEEVESPMMGTLGTIASLVHAANRREGDALSVASVASVASSNVEAIGQRSMTPLSEGKDATSDISLTGSSTIVMSPRGPSRSCLSGGVNASETVADIELVDKSIAKNRCPTDATLQESDRFVATVEPISDLNFLDLANLASTTLDPSGHNLTGMAPKPPMYPSRPKEKKSQQNAVDDNASVISAETQGSHRSSASTNKSRSFKRTLKGMFSRKDSKGERKEAKRGETDKTLQPKSDSSKLVVAKDDVYSDCSFEERRYMNKIQTFIMEAVALLNEAATFIDRDAAEVEIFTSKAFAYANEAEKLVTTHTSAAWKDDADHLSSKSVASSSTRGSTASFVHRQNRQEQVRRLQGVSFTDFGHSGLQSLLCNGGGTIPVEQTRSLAFETMQILETLARNTKFSPQIAARIHSATSLHARDQWASYGNKRIGTNAICGRNNVDSPDHTKEFFNKMDEVGVSAAAHEDETFSSTVRPLPENTDFDGNELSSLVADDDSSYMAGWSRKRGTNTSHRKLRFRKGEGSTAGTINCSFSNEATTPHPQVYGHVDDNETSCGSYTAGASIRDSTIDHASSASTTSTVVKDFMDVIAYQYCDRLCGGPSEFVHAQDGDSVVDLDYYSNA